MKDRIPAYPGRVTLTPVSGAENTYDMIRADEPEEEGTPLTKGNLLSDTTAELLGFDITTDDPTVNDALLKLMKITSGAVGDIICSVRRTNLGDDWHVCDGSLLDQSAYTELASAMDDNVHRNAFYNTSWILPDTTPTSLYSGAASYTFSDYVHSGVIDVCMYGSDTFSECKGLAVLVEGSATCSGTTYQTVCIYYIDDISGMTQDEISDLNNYTAMPRAFRCLMSSTYTKTLLYHAKLSYTNSSLVLVMSCDRNATSTDFGYFYRYTVSDGAISTSYSYASLTSSTSSYGWNVLDVNYSSTYSTYYIIAVSKTSSDVSTVYCLHYTSGSTFSAENALSSVSNYVSGANSELAGMCSPSNDASFCIVSVSSSDTCYIYRYALTSATTVSSGTSLSYDDCTNFYITVSTTGVIYIVPYYTYYGSLSTTHYSYYHEVYFNGSSVSLRGSGNTSGINTANTLSGFLVGRDSDSGSTTCFPLLTIAYDTGGCIAYNTAVSTAYDTSTWDAYGCSNSGFSGVKSSGVPTKIFLDGNEYMANTSGIMATFPTHLKLPNMKLQTALNIGDSYYGYLQDLSEVYINNEEYYIRVK